MISMSWTNGNILSSNNNEHLTNDQAIVWQGYISPPRDEIYQFKLRLIGITGTIYLDQEMIYDSALNFQKSLSLNRLCL